MLPVVLEGKEKKEKGRQGRKGVKSADMMTRRLMLSLTPTTLGRCKNLEWMHRCTQKW